jgi:multidrug resistance efflux pump
MTAPLEGIIESISVKPGDYVKKGDVLFRYNREAPLQELEVARKQVEILISEIRRASTLGFNDPQARKDLSILTVKLEKEKATLEFAEYQASQLDVKAPEAGVILLDNPDEWRGNPVRVGEKVLAITDPKESKIRMWLPESDNVAIDPKKAIKIYLNISPETSYKAELTYIANESVISEKHIPSFIAEAEWLNKPKEVRLGLKGSAVLYGEQVPLIYYVLRKPWGYIRELLGI